MQLIGALLALLMVAFVVSLVVSFLVNIVAGALSLLPAVFVILAAAHSSSPGCAGCRGG